MFNFTFVQFRSVTLKILTKNDQKIRYTDFRVDPNVHWIDLKSGQVVCSFPLVNNLVTYQNKFRRSLKRLI